MEKEELLSLLQNGEGSRIEWKRQINIQGDKAKEEFIKDLTAMANVSTGDGYIIFGITDTGQVVGVPKKIGLEESLQQIAANRCHPPVEFYCEWVELDGKKMFVIHVPESTIRPHATSKKDVYIRREKIIDKATPLEINRMMLSELTNSSVPKPLTSLDDSETTDYDLIRFLRYDLHFFPFSGPPQAYRICPKCGDFDSPVTCPIFMPHYGIFVPEPEFGNTKSVISFELEGHSLQVKRDTFYSFLKLMERKVFSLSDEARIWDHYPLSWSLSKDREMDYGLGADNAKLALDAHSTEGLFGGIMLFERVNVYKPTSFLTFVAEVYFEEDTVFLNRFALKILLSTLPLSNDWINKLFSTIETLGYILPSRKPGDDAISEALYTLNWIPASTSKKIPTLKPDVLGLLGRDCHIPGLEDAMGLGFVIGTSELQGTKHRIDEENSSNWKWYSQIFKTSPLVNFGEIPVQITNHVPTFSETRAGDFMISIPTVRQVIVSLGGFNVIAINAHSFPFGGRK